MVHRAVSFTFQLLLIGAIGALILGHVLGQPVLFGYVSTGSMEPALEAGDGFVAVPSAVAGEPSVGDVVVYESTDGESLTTHRIVGETETGYITKGDANPFTDQDSGTPAVRRGQIVAIALQVGGSVVRIHHLGTAVETMTATLEGWLERVGGQIEATTLALVVLSVSIVLYAADTLQQTTIRSSDSSPIDRQRLSLAVALLVVLVSVAAMVVPAGTHSFDVISAEFESDRPLVIERGSTAQHDLPLPNAGIVPVVSYLEPESASIVVESQSTVVGPRDQGTVPLSIRAPQSTGYYPQYVTEYRYLYVLPVAAIDALHRLHPLLPTVTIAGLLGGVAYGITRLFARFDSPRVRRRQRRERLNPSSGWVR